MGYLIGFNYFIVHAQRVFFSILAMYLVCLPHENLHMPDTMSAVSRQQYASHQNLDLFSGLELGVHNIETVQVKF